jgi:hypothetical protein
LQSKFSRQGLIENFLPRSAHNFSVKVRLKIFNQCLSDPEMIFDRDPENEKKSGQGPVEISG